MAKRNVHTMQKRRPQHRREDSMGNVSNNVIRGAETIATVGVLGAMTTGIVGAFAPK